MLDNLNFVGAQRVCITRGTLKALYAIVSDNLQLLKISLIGACLRGTLWSFHRQDFVRPIQGGLSKTLLASQVRSGFGVW
jgi:hypothetical protein